MGLFEKRIKELRKRHRLSQKEFGEAIGVSFGAISKYENGETIPSVDTLINISKLFDCSSDWLLGLSQEETLSHRYSGIAKMEFKQYQDEISDLQTKIDELQSKLDELNELTIYFNNTAVKLMNNYSELEDAYDASCGQLEELDKKINEIYGGGFTKKEQWKAGFFNKT